MPPAPWAVLKKAIDPFQLPENICFVTRVSSRKNEHCCRACTHIHIDTYAYREKERERETEMRMYIYIYMCVYVYLCVCMHKMHIDNYMYIHTRAYLQNKSE